jgi:hypothetical protein
MSTWMWLNICFGALFIAAVVGVPLWMVIARPDTGPRPAPTSPLLGRRTAEPRSPSRHTPIVATAGRPVRRHPAGVS